MTRPRGLCNGCYYTPEVKELYPVAQLHGLAMPVRPLGDEDTVPGPYQPEPERPKLGDWRGNWGTPPSAWQLTPDTEPEAIAASQRGEVIEAMAALGPTASLEQISDYTVLPVWTVRRRLDELGSGI